MICCARETERESNRVAKLLAIIFGQIYSKSSPLGKKNGATENRKKMCRI
jgi:hypothetical protein